jgi:hypothetical protein
LARRHRGHTRGMPAAPDGPCALQREGLPPELAAQIVQQFRDEHAERFLLAFVHGYLGDPDLWAVRTEAEKRLVLTTLNIVECLAFVGPAATAR